MSQPDSEAPSKIESPKQRYEIGLSLIALLAFVGAAYVAHPVWMGIVLGTAMGFTSEPLYRWLAPKLRYNRPLAAVLTTMTGGLLSAIALFLISWIAVTEVLDMVSEIKIPSGEELLGPRGERILEKLRISPDTFVAQLNAALLSTSQRLAGSVAEAVAATTSLMLTSVIAFFTMYYVLLEWTAMVRRLEHVMPLDPRHTRALLTEFRSIGRSALVGTMGTAVVQGLFAGVGFALAGVSQPMLWGTITMLASFLPVVGTAVVWVPIAIATAASGRTGAGIFVGLWGFFVVMAVSDYIVRPRLVGSKGQVHPLPLLISLLGGVEMFGLMGVIVGPILMALCLSVIRIYEQEHPLPGD